MLKSLELLELNSCEFFGNIVTGDLQPPIHLPWNKLLMAGRYVWKITF